MNGPELLQHCGTDAMKWAEKFKEICEENYIAEPQNDEGYMVGWFANAMCLQEQATVEKID